MPEYKRQYDISAISGGNVNSSKLQKAIVDVWDGESPDLVRINTGDTIGKCDIYFIDTLDQTEIDLLDSLVAEHSHLTYDDLPTEVTSNIEEDIANINPQTITSIEKNLPAGDYELRWWCEIKGSHMHKKSCIQLCKNDTILRTFRFLVDDWTPSNGRIPFTLVSAESNIYYLKAFCDEQNTIVSVMYAHLEIQEA
jgi:hypothetical protein